MARKSSVEKVRVAGEGGDGNTYGVSRIVNKGRNKHVARLKPCPTCPWRKDAEIGRFPPEAYRISANTCYDASMSTFACHESGSENAATCAGFLLANSANNISVRLGLNMDRLDIEAVGNPDGVELYESYRAMAIANGVDEDDPRIAMCRGDDEDGFVVAERIRKTGAVQPRTQEEYVRALRDEDELNL